MLAIELCSSTDKTDRHDIPEILLKVVLTTIKQTNKQTMIRFGRSIEREL
jgi:hypothetical protein